MSKAQQYVREFNNLHGKKVNRSMLEEFLHKISGYAELKGVIKRVKKAISSIGVGTVKLDVTPAAKLSVKKSRKASRTMASTDTSLLYGLECLQDDNELDGKPLDGINDTTYKVITDRILALIKAGGLVWRKPWNEKINGPTMQAHNYVTKHIYRAGNAYLNFLNESMGGLTVLIKGKKVNVSYTVPYFMTFKQISELGGKVKRDEPGWPVVYFKWLYKDLKANKLVREEVAMIDGKLKQGYEKIPGLFYYNVFNADQCTGLKLKPVQKVRKTVREKIESAEKIVEGMPQRPPIEIVRGDRAFYRPSTDSVTMPLMEQFKTEQQFYSTEFHELVHSTGHPKRLDRDLSGRFGSKSYAFEELIAELGASFLCGESGILYFTMKNSAAYIESWSKALVKEMTQDPKFFLRAASQAQKAADFILDRAEPQQYALPEESSISTRKKPNRIIAKKTATRTAKSRMAVRSTAKRNGVLSGHDIASMQFRELDLDGEYKKAFVRLFLDTLIMIWGTPGSGKTVYLLKFAQYMAEQKALRVLYIAAEEYGRSTFTEKVRDFNIHHANLKFVKNFDQLQKEGLSLSEFDVIFLDSVQKLGMDVKKFIEFYEANPNKIIVAIIQSTKDGDFRGGKDWEHEVDIAGEIVNRELVLRKNRLQKGSVQDPGQPEPLPAV